MDQQKTTPPPVYTYQQQQPNSYPPPQNPVYTVTTNYGATQPLLPTYNTTPNTNMYATQQPQQYPPQPMMPPPQVIVTMSPRYEDPAKLGGYLNFLSSLLLSHMLPLLSLVFVFAFESTMMTKLGAIFANLNIMFWTALYMISLGSYLSFLDDEAYQNCLSSNFYNNNNYYYCTRQDDSWAFSVSSPFFIFGIAFSIWAGMYFRKYMRLYQVADPKERSTPLRNIGRNMDFVGGFMVSFFFPVVGTAIIIGANRTVKCRYGAIVGMASIFLALGIASSGVWFMGFISGNPQLLVGLVLLECAIVHFRRIIVSSEITYGYTM